MPGILPGFFLPGSRRWKAVLPAFLEEDCSRGPACGLNVSGDENRLLFRAGSVCSRRNGEDPQYGGQECRKAGPCLQDP